MEDKDTLCIYPCIKLPRPELLLAQRADGSFQVFKSEAKKALHDGFELSGEIRITYETQIQYQNPEALSSFTDTQQVAGCKLSVNDHKQRFLSCGWQLVACSLITIYD